MHLKEFTATPQSKFVYPVHKGYTPVTDITANAKRIFGANGSFDEVMITYIINVNLILKHDYYYLVY